LQKAAASTPCEWTITTLTMQWPLPHEQKNCIGSGKNFSSNLPSPGSPPINCIRGSRMECREIWLPFRPMSKARPRFSGHAYTDKVYAKWKGDVRSFLQEWWTDPPLTRLNVLVAHFYGPARGDLDNRIGSVLDAGKGVLFTDDAVTVIPALVLRHEKASEAEARIYMMLVWEVTP